MNRIEVVELLKEFNKFHLSLNRQISIIEAGQLFIEKKFNNSASDESRDISENEHTKKDFIECMSCKKLLHIRNFNKVKVCVDCSYKI
jgi:hypothetical protein